MTTSDQKIVQYLNEAHAMEQGLTRVLQAQIAMAPRGTFRQGLERHLTETENHAERLRSRLTQLEAGSNPIALGIGLVESVIGQALALAKTPLDVIRGRGGEEKVLKNAKDACATESLEIATYTALERLAASIGDPRTVKLARSICADEERMLDRLLGELPQLAQAVTRAEVRGESSYDVSETGAADAARAAGRSAKRTATKAKRSVSRTPASAGRSARRATSGSSSARKRSTGARSASPAADSGRTASGSGSSGRTNTRSSGSGRATNRPGSSGRTNSRSSGPDRTTNASTGSGATRSAGPASSSGRASSPAATGSAQASSPPRATSPRQRGSSARSGQTSSAESSAVSGQREPRTAVTNGGASEPWPGYDRQTPEEVRAALDHAPAHRAEQVRAYEQAHKERPAVIEKAAHEAAERETVPTGAEHEAPQRNELQG